MESRTTGRIRVPEVDREEPVRAIDEELSAGSKNAEKLLEKRIAYDLAIRKWTHCVARHRGLLDAEMLDDAGADDHIEVSVGKRQRHGASHDQPISAPPFAPLPLPQRRQIVAPGIHAGITQEIDGE